MGVGSNPTLGMVATSRPTNIRSSMYTRATRGVELVRPPHFWQMRLVNCRLPNTITILLNSYQEIRMPWNRTPGCINNFHSGSMYA